MKTIKIMIAALEELHEEKLEFTNLIEHLNEVLEPRGIELRRIKWNPEGNSDSPKINSSLDSAAVLIIEKVY